MNIDLLQQFVKNHLQDAKKLAFSVKFLMQQNPSMYRLILEHTSFLPVDAPLKARYYCIINNMIEHPKCKTCGSKTTWHRSLSQGFKQYCNTTCKNLDPAQQQLSKNGIYKNYKVNNVSELPWIVEKRKQTSLLRYGTSSPAQSEQIKLKTILTNRERYGVDHPNQLQEYKQKIAKTNYNRYGVNYIQQHPDFKQKTSQTNLKRYSRNCHTQQHISEESLEKLNNKDWLYNQHIIQQRSILNISHELNVWDTTVARYMQIHDIPVHHFYRSTGEKELCGFIESHLHPGSVVPNVRSVISHELDIYIPSLKLAFEYCGLYWHSEQQGKDRNYHYAKFLECQQAGIQLVTIFEDEWEGTQDLVKQKILYLLNLNCQDVVYARNTSIGEVTAKQKNQFFAKYHIQGAGPGSISYGLFDNVGEMVACVTLIQQSDATYVLNRYATSKHVVGGFSKLLKHFQKNNKWTQIITFADQRWSLGILYEKTGFTLDNILPPDYYYIVKNKRLHKFNFRRKNLQRLLLKFDPTLSEKQNCDNNKILRIWDCGKKRYILKNPGF